MKAARDLLVTGTTTLPSALPEKLLTVRDLEQLTGMSRRWLHEQTRRGTIPCYRFGTQLRFDPEEVRVWLARYHQAPDERPGGR